MSDVFNSIMNGLTEVLDDAKSKEKKLKRRVVSVIPVKKYTAEEVKRIRQQTEMSQKTFASYLGVSEKTVEAWEAGVNTPSGTASRILHMMEMDDNLIEKFPFIQYEKVIEKV